MVFNTGWTYRIKMMPLFFSVLLLLLSACGHQESQEAAGVPMDNREVALSDVAGTAMDLVLKQHLQLDGPVLDVAATMDGNLVLILLHEKLAVYSRAEQRVVDRLPIDGVFDRLDIDREDRLVLSSSTRPDMALMQVERIHAINIAGRHYRGGENASVVFAVFDDYQ